MLKNFKKILVSQVFITESLYNGSFCSYGFEANLLDFEGAKYTNALFLYLLSFIYYYFLVCLAEWKSGELRVYLNVDLSSGTCKNLHLTLSSAVK